MIYKELVHEPFAIKNILTL